MIDVFVLGILRRLAQGDLCHDGVTEDQRHGLHVLTGRGLATFGEQPEPRVSRLSWRITDKGRLVVAASARPALVLSETGRQAAKSLAVMLRRDSSEREKRAKNTP